MSGEVARILEFLRRRVQAEQESAEEFMRAAINLKDDLARMIFQGSCKRLPEGMQTS
ncbi:MAG: hypothetical protein L2C94_002135 [Aigarchaeota archaeon]|nr:hypothetical protein [Candidatus Wolframiiraptor gerlachensis]